MRIFTQALLSAEREQGGLWWWHGCLGGAAWSGERSPWPRPGPGGTGESGHSGLPPLRWQEVTSNQPNGGGVWPRSCDSESGCIAVADCRPDPRRRHSMGWERGCRCFCWSPVSGKGLSFWQFPAAAANCWGSALKLHCGHQLLKPATPGQGPCFR